MSAKFWIEIEIFRKFEETTHTQKNEKTHWRKKKTKIAEMREESQTTVLAKEKPNKRCEKKKKKQTGINVEKSQASIPENQTIVPYTYDGQVSFKDNMVSKNTANKLILMQFQSKKHCSFPSTSF